MISLKRSILRFIGSFVSLVLTLGCWFFLSVGYLGISGMLSTSNRYMPVILGLGLACMIGMQKVVR